MASGIRGIWAIDMGSNSLKALRMRSSGDNIEIIGFDYIEHSKLLVGDKSVCKEEADQIMAETLHQFVERNDVLKDEVAIAMAGQNSFARFIKLPPVEPKGIPKIVQYEAVQHGHTAQGDKAYRGTYRKGHAANREGQDAADPKAQWGLVGLRTGFCIDFLMDSTAATKQVRKVDKGYVVVPAAYYRRLNPALEGLVGRRPEFAQWIPASLCIISANSVTVGGRTVSDDDPDKRQMVGFWGVAARPADRRRPWPGPSDT